MTTPDPTTVRTWARNNGFKTGDRGRLPTTVLDAYTKAHSRSITARSTKAAAKSAPAAAKTSRSGQVPSTKATSTKATTARTEDAGTPDKTSRAKAATVKKTTRAKTAAPVEIVTPDRVIALEKQVADLTSRLAALESASTSAIRNGTWTRDAGTRDRGAAHQVGREGGLGGPQRRHRRLLSLGLEVPRPSLFDVSGPVGRVVQGAAAGPLFAPVTQRVVPALDRALSRLTGGRILLAHLFVPALVLTTTSATGGLQPASATATLPAADGSSS